MVVEQVPSRRWQRHPVLADAALVVALLLADLAVAPRIADAPVPTAVETLAIAATLAAVVLRSRAPVAALCATTVGAVVVLLLRGVESLSALAPLLALYTLALRSDRRTTVLAWASTAATLGLAAVLGSPSDALLEEALPVLPWTAVAAAVGDGLRNRRAYLAAVEERALRAERSREQEALSRVAQERLRIARELHDVVAHHMAVVSVQAGAAEHLVTVRPAEAAEALGHVRRAAAAVLRELGEILTVLREPGDARAGGAPAPGLSSLESLVDSFSAAGLVVDWSLQGQPRPVAPTVDLVAYRVLEEGLTNALKHGTGTAHLDVGYEASSLRLRVLNRVPAQPPDRAGDGRQLDVGTGHGLLGMHERAAAVGGTLTAAAAPGDAFVVEALLPLGQDGS